MDKRGGSKKGRGGRSHSRQNAPASNPVTSCRPQGGEQFTPQPGTSGPLQQEASLFASQMLVATGTGFITTQQTTIAQPKSVPVSLYQPMPQQEQIQQQQQQHQSRRMPDNFEVPDTTAPEPRYSWERQLLERRTRSASQTPARITVQTDFSMVEQQYSAPPRFQQGIQAQQASPLQTQMLVPLAPRVQSTPQSSEPQAPAIAGFGSLGDLSQQQQQQPVLNPTQPTSAPVTPTQVAVGQAPRIASSTQLRHTFPLQPESAPVTPTRRPPLRARRTLPHQRQATRGYFDFTQQQQQPTQMSAPVTRTQQYATEAPPYPQQAEQYGYCIIPQEPQKRQLEEALDREAKRYLPTPYSGNLMCGVPADANQAQSIFSGGSGGVYQAHPALLSHELQDIRRNHERPQIWRSVRYRQLQPNQEQQQPVANPYHQQGFSSVGQIRPVGSVPYNQPADPSGSAPPRVRYEERPDDLTNFVQPAQFDNATTDPAVVRTAPVQGSFVRMLQDDGNTGMSQAEQGGFVTPTRPAPAPIVTRSLPIMHIQGPSQGGFVTPNQRSEQQQQALPYQYQSADPLIQQPISQPTDTQFNEPVLGDYMTPFQKDDSFTRQQQDLALSYQQEQSVSQLTDSCASVPADTQFNEPLLGDHLTQFLQADPFPMQQQDLALPYQQEQPISQPTDPCATAPADTQSHEPVLGDYMTQFLQADPSTMQQQGRALPYQQEQPISQPTDPCATAPADTQFNEPVLGDYMTPFQKDDSFTRQQQDLAPSYQQEQSISPPTDPCATAPADTQFNEPLLGDYMTQFLQADPSTMQQQDLAIPYQQEQPQQGNMDPMASIGQQQAIPSVEQQAFQSQLQSQSDMDDFDIIQEALNVATGGNQGQPVEQACQPTQATTTSESLQVTNAVNAEDTAVPAAYTPNAEINYRLENLPSSNQAQGEPSSGEGGRRITVQDTIDLRPRQVDILRMRGRLPGYADNREYQVALTCSRVSVENNHLRLYIKAGKAMPTGQISESYDQRDQVTMQYDNEETPCPSRGTREHVEEEFTIHFHRRVRGMVDANPGFLEKIVEFIRTQVLDVAFSTPNV